eukprot:TRINITY_DN4500_c1_g1_i1.p1 TRINITY_DN4500_c1_g1~~TRINITY_DN4500_c1_g1_i1.p1  ORF type:complete len:158 (+),score=5.50 TRINITY_DN4500_c1_g1_i1:51-524(+)
MVSSRTPPPYFFFLLLLLLQASAITGDNKGYSSAQDFVAALDIPKPDIDLPHLSHIGCIGGIIILSCIVGMIAFPLGLFVFLGCCGCFCSVICKGSAAAGIQSCCYGGSTSGLFSCCQSASAAKGCSPILIVLMLIGGVIGGVIGFYSISLIYCTNE